MKELAYSAPEKHFFVCVNDRTIIQGEVKPSCSPRIQKEDVKAIKRELVANGYAGIANCTSTGCLGYCNEEGCNLVIYPEGKMIQVKDKEELREVILKEVQKIQ